MGQKIKSVRKKIGNNEYDLPISLGADGKNIDMQSGLNLEEQFKMGGLQNIDISQDQFGVISVSGTYYNNDGTASIGAFETRIEDSQLDNNGDPVSLTTVGSTLRIGEKVFAKQTVLASTASQQGNIQVRERWI